MKKKILLVDDDKNFLALLKDGLQSSIYDVVLCSTVNFAIKQIITTKFDMIITDLQMPDKSGLELLMFLKEIKYPGGIMVMTERFGDKLLNTLNSFNVNEIIAKPVQIKWLEKKIENILEKEEGYVTFKSIDIMAVMQVINLEKKTAMLEVKTREGFGYIFFENGEIINAIYKEFEGEEAIIKLIANNIGILLVKPTRRKVRKIMEISFVKYMMEIMKTIDELRNINELSGDPGSSALKEMRNSIRIKEPFQHLREIKGCIDAIILSAEGETIESLGTGSSFNIEESISFIYDILIHSQEMVHFAGFESLDTIQFDTPKGIILAKVFGHGEVKLFALLFLHPQSEIEKAKTRFSDVLTQILQNLL